MILKLLTKPKTQRIIRDKQTIINEIVINDKKFLCNITRKPVKTLRVKFDHQGQLVVTAPMSMKDFQIYNFVKGNTSWIWKTYLKMNESKMYDFNTDNLIHILGKKYDVSYKLGKTNRILMTSPSEVSMQIKTDTFDDKMDAYKKYLKQRSDEVMKPMIDHWCKIMNLGPDTITYRYMKTRWGVCNRSRKKITLNIMLLMFSEDIIEYVVVHELCHFFEMNHSPRYWAHVEKYLPNYKQIVKKMKRGGLNYD